jgi:hypothetical protein
MSSKLRLLIVFGAPVFVGAVNLFHPVHFAATGAYDAIAPVAGWWITLHVLNLAGFSLIGLAAYLLLDGRAGVAAAVGRVGLAVFVPVYAGFDAIIGIGTGSLVQIASSGPPGQLEAMKAAVDAYWNAGAANTLAVFGSAVWGISLTACAIAVAEPKRRLPLVAVGLLAGAVPAWGHAASTFGSLPWWIAAGAVYVLALVVARPSMPVALLFMTGLLFGTTHVPPYGPLGMACFVVASALIEAARAKAPLPEPARAPAA